MRKILSGVLGIVAVFAVVGASAYALFTSQATVNGIHLETGSAALQVSLGGDDNFQSTRTLPAEAFQTLIPGEDDWGEFALKNNSTDPDLALNVTARLTSAEGDWNALKDVIEAVVYIDDNSSTATTGATTQWRTLDEWNTTDVIIPGSPIAQNITVNYIVRYRLAPSAGNEVAGMELNNVTFVFTGTQDEE